MVYVYMYHMQFDFRSSSLQLAFHGEIDFSTSSTINDIVVVIVH